MRLRQRSDEVRDSLDSEPTPYSRPMTPARSMPSNSPVDVAALAAGKAVVRERPAERDRVTERLGERDVLGAGRRRRVGERVRNADGVGVQVEHEGQGRPRHRAAAPSPAPHPRCRTSAPTDARRRRHRARTPGARGGGRASLLSELPIASSAASRSSIRSSSAPGTSDDATAVGQRGGDEPVDIVGVQRESLPRSSSVSRYSPSPRCRCASPEARQARRTEGPIRRPRRGARAWPGPAASRRRWRGPPAPVGRRATCSGRRVHAVAGRGGEPEVVGEREHVVGLHRFERDADPAVEPHAGRQPELVVERGAHQRMREPVLTDAGLDEESRGECLVERGDERRPRRESCDLVEHARA